MLEQLLSGSRLGLPKLPLDTGPGPQELSGYNGKVGFFGEVTSQELFNESELSEYIGLGEGLVRTSDPIWLKFFYNKRVIFVSRTPIRHSLSYDTLDRLGVIRGNLLIPKDNYWFKLRLLKTVNENYSGIQELEDDADFTNDSEWNNLIYSVSSSNPKGPVEGFPRYSNSQLGVGSGSGSSSLMQELMEDNINLVFTRGNESVFGVSSVDRSSITSSNGWRVALELIEESLRAPYLRSVSDSFIDSLPLEDKFKEPLRLNIGGLFTPSDSFIDSLPLEDRLKEPVRLNVGGVFTPPAPNYP